MSLRHNDRTNMSFVDGHVESLTHIDVIKKAEAAPSDYALDSTRKWAFRTGANNAWIEPKPVRR